MLEEWLPGPFDQRCFVRTGRVYQLNATLLWIVCLTSRDIGEPHNLRLLVALSA
jgi:hypothetical protein